MRMSKKTVLPKLRFPEFKNNGEWEEKNLGKVLIKNSNKNKNSTYSLVQSVSNKYGFINQSEYFDNRRVASKDTSNYYIIKKGYFAYNPSRIDVGSLAYKHDSEISIISPLYVSFKVKNELLIDNFLLNWFSSASFTKQMVFEGGVRNTLNFENLIQIKIGLPSLLAEQQKITDCLSSLDDLIAAEDKKLTLLKTHKKGLMQKLFPAEGETIPEVRFEGYTGDWEQRKLGEVYDIYSGQTPFRGDLDNFLNPTTAWIKTTDLNNASITENEEDISDKALKKLQLLPIGTVLIAMYGGFNQIGRTGMLTYPATINQAISALPPVDYVDPYFLITELNHNVEKWKIVAASSRKDANITKKDVEKFSLKNPELPEQIAISTFFCNLDEVITAQTEKIEALKLHKKGLMQGLFPSVQEVFG